jgi:anti-sigma regulatory factor (Ser/Thr protein kinase)
LISVASAVAERCGDRNNDAAMRQPGNDDTLRPDTSPRDRRHRKDPAVRARPALYLQLPADPIAPSVARHRVRRWLTGSCWPPGQQEDIVLAVSEAVSNAIEHAYRDDQLPEVVDISGEIEAVPGGQRRVTVIVRDHGRWRPPPIDDENRRRGIPLMRACVDTVTIGQPDDNRVGTSVVLRSRVVPSLPRALGAGDNDINPPDAATAT